MISPLTYGNIGPLPETFPSVSTTFDSLPGVVSTLPIPPVGVLGTGSGREISAATEFPAVFSLTDNLTYQLLALAILIACCLVIGRYGGEFRVLFKLMSGKIFGGKFTEEYNYFFVNFLNTVSSLGFFMIGMVVVKGLDMYAAPEFRSALPPVVVPFLGPSVAIACILVALFQSAVLRIIGHLTLALQFTRRILFFKKLFFGAVTSLLALPTLLLLLNRSVSQQPIFYFVVLLAALLLLYFIYKTWMLFVEQKVSFLLWFLYLCSVEAMPVCILLLIVRSYV